MSYRKIRIHHSEINASQINGFVSRTEYLGIGIIKIRYSFMSMVYVKPMCKTIVVSVSFI